MVARWHGGVVAWWHGGTARGTVCGVAWCAAWLGTAHTIDMMNGGFAGLCGITASSGFVDSQSALLIGTAVGFVSWKACLFLKRDMGIDDVLDTCALQAVPGAMGTILIGVFAGGEPFVGTAADGAGVDDLHTSTEHLVTIGNTHNG